MASMASTVLHQLLQPVHETYFPYPLVTTLHAVRISIAYQANARKSRLSWPTYLAGFLLMCWGGSFASHFILHLPPPMLYSFHPYLNYVPPHLLLTAIFYVAPGLLSPPIIDTLLFPLDALVRTTAVIGVITMLTSGAGAGTNQVLVDSPLAHMIFGAIGSSGGGVIAATVGAWNPNWSLGTPVFLREGMGIWETVDVWGGALVAAIYSTLTNHYAFHQLFYALGSYPLGIVSPPQYEGGDPQPLSSADAKLVAGLVLTVLFGIRVAVVHWGVGKSTGKSTGKKTKTQ